MDKTEHIDCILAVMAQRRALVKGVLGEFYPVRVAIYIKAVQHVMDEKGINEMTAALEILKDGSGRFDSVTCALISAAAIEITENAIVAEVAEAGDQPHLSSLIFKGGLAPAVLVEGCERREGVDHE